MDAIYHRTHLGESLLRSLETLCQRGELEPAEARRIVSDFDQIMGEELRSPDNFGPRKSKLKGKVVNYHFADMPRNKRDPRWTGQGGSTWVMNLVDATFQIGGKTQRLEGSTQVLFRHPVGVPQTGKRPGRPPSFRRIPAPTTASAKVAMAEKRSVGSGEAQGAKGSARDRKRSKGEPKPTRKKAAKSFWVAGRARGKGQGSEREEVRSEALGKRGAGKRMRSSDSDLSDGTDDDKEDCGAEGSDGSGGDAGSDGGETGSADDLDDLLGYLGADVNGSNAVGCDSRDAGRIGVESRSDTNETREDDDDDSANSGDDEESIEARMDEFADLLDGDADANANAKRTEDCSSSPEAPVGHCEESERNSGDEQILDEIVRTDALSDSGKVAQIAIPTPSRPGQAREASRDVAQSVSDSDSDSCSVADEDVENMLSAFDFGTKSRDSTQGFVQENRTDSGRRGDGSEASPNTVEGRSTAANAAGHSVSRETSERRQEDAESGIEDSEAPVTKVSVPASGEGTSSGSDDDGDDDDESDEDIRDMEAFLQRSAATLLE